MTIKITYPIQKDTSTDFKLILYPYPNNYPLSTLKFVLNK